MRMIVMADGRIRYASNADPEALPALLKDESVVEVTGDADAFDWPHRAGASACLWDGASVVANPDIPGAGSQRKAAAKVEIDRRAEAARQRFITPGAAQQAVYLRKVVQAERIKDDPSPTAANYPLLAVSIGIEVTDTGDAVADMNAVADIVLSTRAAWEKAAAAIERARLGAKKEIDALPDPPTVADIRAILDNLTFPSPQ